jgi:ATP-dependent RNA helicase DDX1
MLPWKVLYPAVCLKNAEMRINFGDSPFKFDPPPGYTGLATAPENVVASAAAAAATASTSNSSSLPLCLVMEPSRWEATT